jgi:sugar phosphate isomerase/epimerase
MLGGRRYEVFEKAADYEAFVKGAAQSLERAAPVAQKQKIILAVENHKDYRVDEMIDLMKLFSSEWIGLTLDTGNNLSLLDDPMSAVELLAPWTRTVHLKDIGVEESKDGFRMAEVPLGRGSFDLQRMIAAVRRANSKARFHLEMITRDPLSIPCLTEKYWATLQKVPGQDLARTLRQVRELARPEPLPRITLLPVEEQIAAEERHVRESFEYWKGLT